MDGEESVLEKVVLQRDRLNDVLAGLVHAISHGLWNGLLPDGEAGGSSKCPAGHTRRHVLGCMGRCCLGCGKNGRKCVTSYVEAAMLEAVLAADEELSAKRAEAPEISVDSFPEYDPDKKYDTSPRRIAWHIYRMMTGYWMQFDHRDDALEKAWEKVFGNVLCISLGDTGKTYRKLLDMCDKNVDQEFCKKFMDDNPDVMDYMEKARRATMERGEDHPTAEGLALRASVFRMEYQFGRKYPGADMSVYSGAVSSIIDDCLKIAGLYPVDAPEEDDYPSHADYDKALMRYKAEHRRKIDEFVRNG